MKIALSLAVATVGAGVAVSAAAGSGEPKNQPPFIRAVPAVAAHAGLVRYAASPAAPVIQPEPKNVLPFTRPANDDPGLAIVLRQIARYDFPAPTHRRSAR